MHLAQLLGANRRFIETHLPHIGELVRGDLESVIAESDVLVLGLNTAGSGTGASRLRPYRTYRDRLGSSV